MQKFRTFSILLVTASITLWLLTPSLAQNQVTETWLVAPIEDCEPPCWLGIVPGESTAADVERIFTSYEDIFIWRSNDDERNEFDEETGYVINGEYYFWWRHYKRDDYYQHNSIVVIEDSIVTLIILQMNEFVTLGEILDLFGQPDDMSLTQSYGQEYMALVYTTPLLQIRLTSGFERMCQIENMRDDFYTEMILYYSFDEAAKIVETEHGNQPRLLAYGGSLKRQIPLDTWETWLNGEVEAYCIEAWNNLLETVELPEFPTADN